jgi:hypothetical protein
LPFALAGVLAGCGGDSSNAPDERPAAEVEAEGPAVVIDTTGDSLVIGDPPTAVPGPLRTPPAEWTHQTTEVTRGSGVATLTAMRTASHEGYDRVVFEIGPSVPGFHIEYVDKPTYECGSGDALFLEGDAWLLIRLRPARAHDDAGQATVTARRQTFTMPVLREAVVTCDFEADLTWVLGLTTPAGYRVTELENPTRLVIDLRH